MSKCGSQGARQGSLILPLSRGSGRPRRRLVLCHGGLSPLVRDLYQAREEYGKSERLKHQSADATADSSTSASKKRRSAWIEQKRVFKSQSPRMNPILALHDPPALLADVVVVLVGTKFGSSAGAIARSCAGFECGELRLCVPRFHTNSRTAMRASCGAQPILEMATVCSNLKEAIQDCDEAVAFARWHAHSRQYSSLSDMIARSSFLSRKGRLALVYGREDLGMKDDEIQLCNACCTIPTGRLAESLSLPHAVSIVLSRLYEHSLKKNLRERLDRLENSPTTSWVD